MWIPNWGWNEPDQMMGNLVWYCPWWRYLHNTLYQPALYNMAIRWKNTIRDGGSIALYPVYIALWKKGWQFKKSGNVQLWKLISLPIFIQFMNVFCGGSLDTLKIGKWKNKVTNINFRGYQTSKRWRGCFSQTKQVSKFSFFYLLWYSLLQLLWKTPPYEEKPLL